jgi:hypothetical protein
MTGWRSEHIVNNSFVKEVLLFAEHSGTELRLLDFCMHSESKSESDGVSVLYVLLVHLLGVGLVKRYLLNPTPIIEPP